MLGSEHSITQIPWDSLFRKNRCFYLNIAGTLDPPPTGLWYNQLASTSKVLRAVVISIFCRPGILPASSEWILPDYSTFTPVSMPVVETLKSRYANISGVGGLYSWGNLFLGKSSARKRKILISMRYENIKIIALQLVFCGLAMA